MIDFDAQVLVPCFAVFGEDLQPMYSPAAGGPAFAFDAIFDDAYMQAVLLDDGAPGFVTTNPTIGVRLAQFAATPVQNDQVVITRTGKTYVVNEVQPDGKGGAVLQLNYVSG